MKAAWRAITSHWMSFQIKKLQKEKIKWLLKYKFQDG